MNFKFYFVFTVRLQIQIKKTQPSNDDQILKSVKKIHKVFSTKIWTSQVSLCNDVQFNFAVPFWKRIIVKKHINSQSSERLLAGTKYSNKKTPVNKWFFHFSKGESRLIGLNLVVLKLPNMIPKLNAFLFKTNFWERDRFRHSFKVKSIYRINIIIW